MVNLSGYERRGQQFVNVGSGVGKFGQLFSAVVANVSAQHVHLVVVTSALLHHLRPVRLLHFLCRFASGPDQALTTAP